MQQKQFQAGSLYWYRLPQETRNILSKQDSFIFKLNRKRRTNKIKGSRSNKIIKIRTENNEKKNRKNEKDKIQ